MLLFSNSDAAFRVATFIQYVKKSQSPGSFLQSGSYKKFLAKQKFIIYYLFIQTFLSGCRSASLLWKYSITTVFWMILWNFSEQSSLTALARSPLLKIITWLRKQTNIQQVNVWDIKKLLNCSSLFIVYHCYVLAWHFLLGIRFPPHKVISSRS